MLKPAGKEKPKISGSKTTKPKIAAAAKPLLEMALTGQRPVAFAGDGTAVAGLYLTRPHVVDTSEANATIQFGTYTEPPLKQAGASVWLKPQKKGTYLVEVVTTTDGALTLQTAAGVFEFPDPQLEVTTTLECESNDLHQVVIYSAKRWSLLAVNITWVDS